MTSSGESRRSRARAAVLVGGAVAFTIAVDLARWIRPALLLQPDPAWAAARLVLGAGLLALAAAGGLAAAAAFALWSRTDVARAPLAPLPFSRGTLAAVTAAALLLGIGARWAASPRVDFPFLEDEVNLIGPALALSGGPGDFADAIRPIPYGRPDPHEMIGVVYLRLLRESLAALGTTTAALRLPSLLGGALSLVTAGLLARALLPRGGAALAVLALAGVRWHVILSLSGWHSILLVPLLDVATLLLLAARRGGTRWPAAAGGAVLGIGAHLYLASWIAAAALAAFCLWPSGSPAPGRLRARVPRLLAFAAGLALIASPLFLLHAGRRIPYFGRSSRHNVLREAAYQRSWMPVLAAAADALPAPWFIPEPEGRHDLGDRSRLGWVAGVAVAVALGRAFVTPRAELSGLLLLHAIGAGGAAVASGTAGHPNGFRFGYLTSITAVAAGAGLLALVARAPAAHRRAAAAAAVGALAIAGALGLRDALAVWPSRRATFDSFRGEDTVIGRAAARWERYGAVAVEPGLGRSDLTIDTVRRYRLTPDDARAVAPASGAASRSIRVARPETAARPGERRVETVRDAWGRDWAVVLARPARG